MIFGRKSTPKGLLVRSTLTKEDFERVYRLLDCPVLNFDCGDLCDRRCCQEYEPGVGIYLLPGEECMFTGQEAWLAWTYHKAARHGFPKEWKGKIQFVTCKGTCPRDKRPVQCRTFPLMPYLDREDRLSVRLDTLTGSLLCPLVRYPKTYPVRSEFRNRALAAWEILVNDPLIRLDVQLQSRRLEQDENAPWKKLLE